MKSTFTLVALLFCIAAQANEQATQLSPFIGKYKLSENKKGACPANLRIQFEKFLNEKSSPSLGIYSEDASGAVDNVIYQMAYINSSRITTYDESPMLPPGQDLTAVNYIFESLNGNLLWADASKYSLPNQQFVRATTFSAELKDGSFSFIRSDITKNSQGEEQQELLSCTYKKQ